MRNDINFQRGTFRVRGDIIEIFPSSSDENTIRVEFFGDEIERISEINSLTGEIIGVRKHAAIYPASHFATTKEKVKSAVVSIKKELDERLAYLKKENRLLEAQRLEQRTMYDLEMLSEMGFCTGIENYSRHLSQRKAGSRPYTLIDYFPKDFITIIDESHVSVPQIRGMYNGDRARKENLVEYGFRLPSALDNRPLKFEEFEKLMNQVIYVSATPGPYEISKASVIAEQLIRPTGIVDPVLEVRKTKGQIDDILNEIYEVTKRDERILITALTKKMAEDLTQYLQELGIKVTYLHSDIDTVKRMEIIRDLRLGVFDVLVGINLLREGLDLPEVSLIAILDADKEGFLRSETSLIQTIGRAARNVNGKVIMYANEITKSMENAILETNRRREVQIEYNKKHNIIPKSVKKDIREIISTLNAADEKANYDVDISVDQQEIQKYIIELEAKMNEAAEVLDFERAAVLRDEIKKLKKQI